MIFTLFHLVLEEEVDYILPVLFNNLAGNCNLVLYYQHFHSGGIMILKRKISLGLAFLFVIIFALAIFCSIYIQKLSQDSNNILKNNYNSIVYAKNMFLALDDMETSLSWYCFNPNVKNNVSNYYIKLFESAKIKFDKNLKAENNNITEIQEKEYVDLLNKNYDIFLNLCGKIKRGYGSDSIYFNELLPAYEKIKQNINSINDVNMHAIVHKNQLTQQHSSNIIHYMALIGAICVVLAFGYFWYFPFYISNSISHLSNKMKGLLKNLGITLDIDSNDETHVILQSINLLENKFSMKDKRKRKK